MTFWKRRAMFYNILSQIFIVKYLLNAENVNAIPGLWRSVTKENVFIPPPPFNENSYSWSIKGDMVDILSTCSKNV